MSALSVLQRVRQSAFTRALLEGAALVFVGGFVSRILDMLMPAKTSVLYAPLVTLCNLLVAALLVLVYWGVVRRLEHRAADELDPRRARLQLPAGFALGLALMAGVYGLLCVAGVARVGPGSGWTGLGVELAGALLTGVFEELLFRGVLFRIVEERQGTTIAMLVSAAFFGFAHGANPGATVFSCLAIAVEAGLLLSAAYALTRNLWLPIGFHAGWNFAEGNVFGALVSGTRPAHSLLHGTLTGPALLTGGDFGPEASVVAVAVCGAVALVFGWLVVRSGRWQTRPRKAASAAAPPQG